MKKILVVDNHPVLLRLMTNLLEREGYRVRTAKDGLSALEILSRYTPDVIFTDLIMRNIDGRKLCRIIKQMPALKDAFVVIFSSAAAEELSHCTEFGADACIAKGPFDRMAVHVLSVLKQWREGKTDKLSKEIIGVERLHPRAITLELLSSKKHFEAILDSISEGIVELTSGDKIVYVNPVAVSLLGQSEVRLLGMSFAELFQGGDRQRIRKLLETADDAPREISEDSPVTVNGIQLTITFLPVIEKEKRAVILVLKDISLRKAMEDRLRHSQKMEAIGTLAGGIAHDFNNILMAIQGNTSLLLLDKDFGHPDYEKLKKIAQYADDGAHLTQQLLGFARGGKYEVRATDLNRLVRSSARMFGRTKKEIDIRLKFQKDLWSVKVDQVQIEQVLMSIYINAWYAMFGGGEGAGDGQGPGTLHIQTENVRLKPEDVRSLKVSAGRYVRVSITDTGVGMDEDTRQKIFEPFFTTREMGRGTGLGLASAYGIIKNHGGFIDVYSRKGKGSKFEIHLPALDPDSIGRPESSVRKKEGIQRGAGVILFVDDEEMITEVGGEILKILGYDPLIAGSGKEAVEIYEKQMDRIDMVVLDMIMPGMGGLETYKQLKAIDPDVKVLLSSGYSLDDQAQEILDQGCNGFIQKPFNIKGLSEKISEILDEGAKGTAR